MASDISEANHKLRKMQNNQESLIVRVADDIQKLYSDPGQLRKLRSSLGRRDWDDKAVLLQDILKLPIHNYSDFNYDQCYSYEINVAPSFYRPDHRILWALDPIVLSDELKKKARIRYHINLYISPLGYYLYILNEILYDKNNKYINTIAYPFGFLPNNMNGIRMEIETFFEKETDYILLDDSILMRQVLGVQLEISDEDKVTVFKCLFCDSEGRREDEIGPPIVDLRHT